MAAAFAGCTLLEPLDGLSEPRDALDGASAEAASAEAATSDSSSGGDAASAVDAGPFCARVDAAFCEDFDDPARATRWTLSNVRKAAHGIDEAASTSPPSSLFATTSALDAGETAESYRRIDFPDRVKSLTYAFDLRIDTRGTQGFLIAEAGLDDTANTGRTYAASVVLGDTTDTVEESSQGATNTYDDHVLASRVPTGKWTRVSVSIQRQDTGSYALVVTIDGQAVVTEALTLWKNLTGGKPFVTVGAGYVPGPSQPWSIRMDSLTLDLK
jgi:hypothetical protein